MVRETVFTKMSNPTVGIFGDPNWTFSPFFKCRTVPGPIRYSFSFSGSGSSSSGRDGPTSFRGNCVGSDSVSTQAVKKLCTSAAISSDSVYRRSCRMFSTTGVRYGTPRY